MNWDDGLTWREVALLDEEPGPWILHYLSCDPAFTAFVESMLEQLT